MFSGGAHGQYEGMTSWCAVDIGLTVKEKDSNEIVAKRSAYTVGFKNDGRYSEVIEANEENNGENEEKRERKEESLSHIDHVSVALYN